MGRSLDLSGGWLESAFYAVQVAVLLSVLLYVALPLESPGHVLLAALFSLVVGATAVGWRRARRGDEGAEHLGTAEDITYDPVAYPGQAAKDRWEKAVRRLPGHGDDQD